MRRLLSIACLTGAVAILTAGPAAATAPRDQGWWTMTNPLPAPPDVPARGLVIQGGASGAPTAFAAVLYELDPGTTAGKLTLAVAPNSLTTPSATLQVCPLLQPIVHPEQGGPMSDAPAYDCSRTVTAAPAANGNYEFDASKVVTDRLLAVAILPSGPVDRVVLNQPDDNSLAVQQAPAATTPPVADTGTAGSPLDLAPAPAPEPFAASPSFEALPTPQSGTPGASASGVPVAPAPAAAPRSFGGGSFVPTVRAAPEEAAPLLVLLLVAGSLGGAGLWLFAGRQDGEASAPA
jgi:hypothetical protein